MPPHTSKVVCFRFSAVVRIGLHKQKQEMPKIPSLYISHGGGPAFFMKAERGSMFSDFDSTSPACKAFTNVGRNPTQYRLPKQPKLIVMISAHWEESDGPFHVYRNPLQQLYYDYSGFPDHTYKLKYPTPSASVEVTKRIVDMINVFPGISAVEDTKRPGFDHGVFLPLMLLYPEAQVPVVQISLHSNSDPVLHYKLGLALQPLREEGVLIVASGQATHPMSKPSSAQTTAKFIKALEDILLPPELTGLERLEQIKHLAKTDLMREAHNPRTEHFTPLLVALGAAGGAPAKDLLGNTERGKDFRAMRNSFSLASFIFEEEQMQAEL